MKNLKVILPLVFVMLSLNSIAQPPRQGMDNDERREKVESMKIAFITNELNLTPEEAKKFWPVYNSFTDEVKKVREARRDRMKGGRDDFNNMSDKDIEKMLDAEIVSRQQELDIQKKYQAQFKEVLPVKKVALLYRAEEDFKRQLLEKIRDKREGGQGSPGREGEHRK